MLGHVLQMKDDRLPKIVLFGRPTRSKPKTRHMQVVWETVIRKDLKETEDSREKYRVRQDSIIMKILDEN